jgi:PTH1 family peptidyl-tRNA hydrolase
MAPFEEQLNRRSLLTKGGLEQEPIDAPLFEGMLVGLGNPGDEYQGSRHNVGFDVVDELAETFQLRWVRVRKDEPFAGAGFSGKVKARVAQGCLPIQTKSEEDPPGSLQLTLRRFLLVKPWTYMNLSGVAVAALARHCRIPPASIFVVYDDLNLPLGRMRIRPEGSSGGHNGIKSLVSCLGTEGFPRLRMGIGASGVPASAMVDPDFVLGSFEEDERPILQQVHAASVEACRSWLAGEELGALMNRWNSFQVEDAELDGDGGSNQPS